MLVDEMKKLIGTIPRDQNEFKRRMRFHQGWWRAFVLGEEQGKNPVDAEKQVCNIITRGAESKTNFLTANAWKALQETLAERGKASSGLLNEDRVYNNLLSSQPLCFNFFGELKQDLRFAAEALRFLEPEVDSIDDVHFEYAPLPIENYTNDHSAFDVAFHFTKRRRIGLIGLEVKYTDDFSSDGKRKDKYAEVFNSSRGKFSKDFEEYFDKRYIQLFRNELIAESMIQRKEIDFAITGLLYHQDDSNARIIGEEFKGMLIRGDREFKLVTYQEYLAELQKLELSWTRREWVMVLWARYCALQLSEAAGAQHPS